ncbi:MAG TPA: SAV_915 family protein [Trebonia sp.]|nr:SAV_915 family protein [Trebonia sp.]
MDVDSRREAGKALTDQQRLVAVPAHPGAGEQVIFEARRQADEVVLPVFSSVRALVAALGESQPWAVLPLSTVRENVSAGGADRLVIDPEVTDEAWRWEPRDLGGFAWPGRTE